MGELISTATADEAAAWLTLFMSGEASDEDRARWAAWRGASRHNMLAWQHIESICGQLESVRSLAAYRAVTTYGRGKKVDAAARRKVIQALAWSGLFAGGAWWAARRGAAPGDGLSYATATGEQRTIELDDGSRVTLDTDSAIAVDFDRRQRTLRLQKGAIYVITAHGSAAQPDARAFTVVSDDGVVRALGTRFSVRADAKQTTVAVEQSAVAVTPRRDPALERLIHAGQQVGFSGRTIGVVEPVNIQTFSWTDGRIVTDDMRLDMFIGELSRYRPGLIRCAPEIASLQISGDFPVANTDQILDSLPQVLPVKITRLTRYWTVVSAR